MAISVWMLRYKMLEEYYKEYGNIDVPVSYSINGIKLGYWLKVQRDAYNGHETFKITEEQIDLLNKLGMKWDINSDLCQEMDPKWMKNYKLLEDYYTKYGNVDVPHSYQVDGVKLGNWLRKQRQAYNGNDKNKLTEEQIKLLNKLGIKWKFDKKTWMEKYKLLEDYYAENGNVDVPRSYQVDGVKLGNWLSTQRQVYKGKCAGRITEEQIDLLNKLCMKWEFREETWMTSYRLLEKYYEAYGDIDVPSSYEVGGVKLGYWLNSQRQAYKGKCAGRITEEQINLLNKLGMKWEFREEIWMNNYKLLEDYYKQHDNIDVPYSYEVSGVKLGKWLFTQRQVYKRKFTSRLTEEQICLLNALEIDWSPRDTKFLNSVISDGNNEKYNVVLLNRLKHVLEDLVYEGLNEISDSESQKEIENIVVKRLWR